MSETPRLTRGVLAQRTGCNIETIRYYERIGLLPEPPRSESGHRLYTDDLLRRLNFILRCRQLGFSLQEVQGLLHLVDSRAYTCAEVKEMTEVHLTSVRSKIGDLKVLEKTLKDMVLKCDGGQIPECPVIDALFRSNGRVPH